MIKNISVITHPDYDLCSPDWLKWRLTFQGGDEFIVKYLRKLSKREDQNDYNDRLAVTYCPAFAKSGLKEVSDSIYERMADIARSGGSESYQSAITGLKGGVDLTGSSMNYFMGCKVLPELLSMGKVGIYVDMPPKKGLSIADNLGIRPYIYTYKCEEIRSWTLDDNVDQNEFKSVLLQEYAHQYDQVTGFPCGRVCRYRRVWKDESGKVWVAFYSEDGSPIDSYGYPTDQIYQLDIDRVPFILCEITESLLTDVANYQIALLNLASTDLSYALKSNYPFYVEQNDMRRTSPHLRPPGQETPGEADDGATGKVQELKMGVSKGRVYPLGANAPAFIHPSSEPLKASMDKEEQLKSEIRMLLKLTISSLRGPKMASAESKEADNRSLETGLSYIGLALENTERKISDFWAMYERIAKIATITYPENYNLRTDEDRRAEANDLQELMAKIPSMTFQKAIAKRISRIMLGPKISREELHKIEKEIDSSITMTSDPEVIAKDVEVGLLSLDSASQIRGYPKGEVEQAKKDHAERLARIAEAQAEAQPANPAARGNPDADPNPKKSAKDEKSKSRDTTKDASVSDKTRGEGK